MKVNLDFVGFVSFPALQVPSLAPNKELTLQCRFFIFCLETGRDLNHLAEGEHNRVFASETQRMMGRAHQVPSLAPKKELRNSEALFLSNPKDWYVIAARRM